MAKIVVTHGVPSAGFDLLHGHEVHIPCAGQAFSREELQALLRDADAVLACGALDEGLIEGAEKLGLIVCYGAGYESVDVAAATRRGVWVCNTPDETTAPTAELAIALMLALGRRVCELNETLRQARPTSDAFGMGKRMGISLQGRTLGIVGLGRIGARVARFGKLMDMRVLYASSGNRQNEEGFRRVTLETLMRESDVVSLHCPLCEKTRGMITRELLFSMKPTAYLINTVRGALVDEGALADALREGALAGAGLDVYCGEPNINPALLSLRNVVLTPHVGVNTLDARNAMARAASRRILDFLDGKTPENLLNPQALFRRVTACE